MTEPLQGKSALVTGAGRGIGRATAVRLASAGVSLALVARSADQLAETAELVREAGATAHVVPADLGDPDQLGHVVQRAHETLGSVDILVNNAATLGPLGPSATVDPAEWTAAITLNVIAPAQLTFALLPGMLERRWGRVLNISSAIVDYPAMMTRANAYVTAKTAIEAHTVNLAAELGECGVTVNGFRPGSVDTAMQGTIRAQDPETIGAAVHQQFTRFHTDNLLITPDAAARVLVSRLCSDVTGRIWDISDPT